MVEKRDLMAIKKLLRGSQENNGALLVNLFAVVRKKVQERSNCPQCPQGACRTWMGAEVREKT